MLRTSITFIYQPLMSVEERVELFSGKSALMRFSSNAVQLLQQMFIRTERMHVCTDARNSFL